MLQGEEGETHLSKYDPWGETTVSSISTADEGTGIGMGLEMFGRFLVFRLMEFFNLAKKSSLRIRPPGISEAGVPISNLWLPAPVLGTGVPK